MGRRGRRRKQLPDDIKETRRYWKLKEGVLDRTPWRTRYGRGCKPVECGVAVNEFTDRYVPVCLEGNK